MLATASETFSFTGGEQAFTVPAGVHLLHVLAVCGAGANDANDGFNGGEAAAGSR
jgi:hypothetical protein